MNHLVMKHVLCCGMKGTLWTRLVPEGLLGSELQKVHVELMCM